MPNPSFEIYDTCPNGYSYPGNIQLPHAIGWFCPTTGTSDYLNICDTVNPIVSGVGIPKNIFGTQFPKSGNACAGFFAYYNDGTYGNYKEYISIQLLAPLEADTEYVVEFFVSLADRSLYGVDQLGLSFSTSAFAENNFNPIHIQPSVKSPQGSPIIDYYNWVSVKGFYFASGSEQFITLGNFVDSNLLTKSPIVVLNDTTMGEGSYYYLDDVKVQKLESWIRLPNVFTPNQDNLNDIFLLAYNKIIQFEGRIYNRWGDEVFYWNDISKGWDGKINSKECSAGTYYVIVNAVGIEGKEYKKTGFLELLR